MSRKRVAVIGRGTVGSMTAAYFHRYVDADISWFFDTSIPPQAVGEGSNLTLPRRMHECLNFSPRDFPLVDGTVKTGIYKENWGASGKSFLHDFPSPMTSIHFNANRLQDYVFDKLKDVIDVHDANVTADDIDADFVMVCSGRPSDYSEFTESEYIPVNAVHVTQCYWDVPLFDYTLTIARPYGWVFGIPLRNRCAIGYLYNKDINTEQEILADVQNVFMQYGLTPSASTNSFSFKNYRRKDNFSPRVSYNGNASFFLEPLEATSFSTADAVNSAAMLNWFSGHGAKVTNDRYQAILNANESIIMLHYAAGSTFKTAFWEFAQERGMSCMQKSSSGFKYMLENARLPNIGETYSKTFRRPNPSSLEFDAVYSAWWEGSFAQNIDGLFDNDIPFSTA